MLDEKGLSPLVATIVLLTVTLAVGAVVAATVAGSPRPTLPLSTALHITDNGNQNLSAGDNNFVITHEWGEAIPDPADTMKVMVNGSEVTGISWGSGNFEIGDVATGSFGELESGQLVKVIYKPRKLTLIEQMIQ